VIVSNSKIFFFLTIAGVVSDEAGLPLVGASVIIKVTHKETITNGQDHFVFHDVDSSATALISFVGYLNKL
jgi:iron complex outermembrane receptor protein